MKQVGSYDRYYFELVTLLLPGYSKVSPLQKQRGGFALAICPATQHLVKRSRPPANANIPPPTPAAPPPPAYTAPGI